MVRNFRFDLNMFVNEDSKSFEFRCFLNDLFYLDDELRLTLYRTAAGLAHLQRQYDIDDGILSSAEPQIEISGEEKVQGVITSDMTEEISEMRSFVAGV
jgi:hypothetical protein